MATKNIAGVDVNVNEEGYLTDHSQWTREIGEAIAKEEGIELTESHWKVMEFLQKEVKENGALPTIRRLTKSGVVDTKTLYQLFPDGPMKKASKIAGLEKPASCV
ncbi:TusE/DsrC/DsvC family sulfur relay protein [bacterium]|nr:TusE/DsrC/DsvC family sulfur relay protein [bacterium]MBU1063782.1 TusE/DsrC/DsvC family sulfur relay protein [bacterium]MBU1633458.1 TusE/DsrC/DsvC family sulfur relay protein [bacterium]MBU1874495.1 TusE/DsrC/DsvC family sulfur relay protein [bacterium]